MRKMFYVATTFLVTLTGVSVVRADYPSQQSRQTTAPVYRTSTPNRTYRYYRGGVFDRLLEMERRANAWPFGGFRR